MKQPHNRYKVRTAQDIILEIAHTIWSAVCVVLLVCAATGAYLVVNP